ncbi:MAG: clostripain-related cysteine peptidase [Bdellovibrionota bacterium]
MNFFWKSLALLLYLALGLTTCFAADSDLFKAAEELQQLKTQAASTTYIFWVHGDAEHFVSKSLSDSRFVNIDQIDVARIHIYAKQCHDCNVLIYHDPRGSDTWWKLRNKQSSRFWVYINGHLVLSRRQPESSVQESSFLAELLSFPHRNGLGADPYFIYRGHTIPPTKSLTGVFDLSNLNLRYNIKDLAKSIKESGQHLRGIVLAACESAYLENFLELSPYADWIIAPQHLIVEREITGFDFSWVKSVHFLHKTNLQRARYIAHAIMNRFENTFNIEEARGEYPVTLFHSPNRAITHELNLLAQEMKKDIIEMSLDKRMQLRSTRGLSARYAAALLSKFGDNEPTRRIFKLLEYSPYENSFDYVQSLKYLYPKHPLLSKIKQSIEVFHLGYKSKSSGMSFLILE